jgi:Ser/Thr protein kinase RdoA (MazF antagonist)
LSSQSGYALRRRSRCRWQTLTVGGEGYCHHESLRTYDERTARLLARIESFGRTIQPDDLPGNDIVHWDLHPGNLLQEGGSLTAIVDTDFAVVGDASFDLVMFALMSLSLRCEDGVRERLFAVAFDELGDLRTRAYLGHLFIRLLDWPIRKGRSSDVDFWLGQADRLLSL